MFTSKQNLKYHNETQHSDKIHECKQCGKTFKAMQLLISHTRNAHNSEKKGPKVTCDKCGKIFKDKKGLEVHIAIIHDNLKKYECNLCNKKF